MADSLCLFVSFAFITLLNVKISLYNSWKACSWLVHFVYVEYFMVEEKHWQESLVLINNNLTGRIDFVCMFFFLVPKRKQKKGYIQKHT